MNGPGATSDVDYDPLRLGVRRRARGDDRSGTLRSPARARGPSVSLNRRPRRDRHATRRPGTGRSPSRDVARQLVGEGPTLASRTRPSSSLPASLPCLAVTNERGRTDWIHHRDVTPPTIGRCAQPAFGSAQGAARCRCSPQNRTPSEQEFLTFLCSVRAPDRTRTCDLPLSRVRNFGSLRAERG